MIKADEVHKFAKNAFSKHVLH